MELRHVVAATDQSAAGHHAVLVAAVLAEKAGARLTALSVKPVPPVKSPDLEHHLLLRDLSRGLKPELTRRAPHTAVEFAVQSGVPGIEIPRYAEKHAGDLLVLGHTQRTQRQRMLLGDTADAVARRSLVPCLLVGLDDEMLGPMLVCLDATERSMTVAQVASGFARSVGIPIWAVTVEPAWLDESDVLAAALPTSRTLRLSRTLDREPVITDLRIRRGNVLAQLLAEASGREARLLAFGYHRGGPPGIVEGGSVARGLLHSAKCAVLTVPL
jgi:nucleotide-binding universal stress UspA family protein